MAVPLLHYDYAGTIQPRVGINHATISPYGAYRSRDNLEVVLAIQNEREWKRFCVDVLERPELPDDERLRSNAQRVSYRELVDQAIDDVFSQMDGEAIVERLNRAGIAYGRLNDVAGLAKHPQLRRLRVKTESGEASVAAVAAIRSNQVSEVRSVPAIGEQSHSIRREFS
jgi:crotonobetainyl-CoA:carnitine CoA-transferase CaiB-like acyl-CoA transferase